MSIARPKGQKNTKPKIINTMFKGLQPGFKNGPAFSLVVALAVCAWIIFTSSIMHSIALPFIGKAAIRLRVLKKPHHICLINQVGVVKIRFKSPRQNFTLIA